MQLQTNANSSDEEERGTATAGLCWKLDGSMQSAYRLPYDLSLAREAAPVRLQLEQTRRQDTGCPLGKPCSHREKRKKFAHKAPLDPFLPSPNPSPLTLGCLKNTHAPGSPRHPPSYSWQLKIMPSPSQSAASSPANLDGYPCPCTAQIARGAGAGLGRYQCIHV